MQINAHLQCITNNKSTAHSFPCLSLPWRKLFLHYIFFSLHHQFCLVKLAYMGNCVIVLTIATSLFIQTWKSPGQSVLTYVMEMFQKCSLLEFYLRVITKNSGSQYLNSFMFWCFKAIYCFDVLKPSTDMVFTTFFRCLTHLLSWTSLTTCNNQTHSLTLHRWLGHRGLSLSDRWHVSGKVLS